MSSGAPALYACLRTPRDPEIAVTVAKEFSPRLQRYASDCVVLDVSGLGRLLGDPQTIGDEIASRIGDLLYGAGSLDGTRIARITKPHETRMSRISADFQGVDYGPGHLALSDEDLLQRSATSASREKDKPSVQSASREKDKPSVQSASREKDKLSVQSASREQDPRWQSRVAVVPSQIGARVLSSAYSGLTVVTGDVASALAPVRLEVLRQVCAEIHGADDRWRSAQSASREMRSAQSASREHDPRSARAFEILERWGLSTLGELAALPAGMLSARLGQAGIELQRMAKGVDVRPLVPDPDVPRFLERIELEWPIDGFEPLAFVLARLLEPLSLALERADRAAAAIHLRLRLVDRTVHARLLQLPAALRDPRVLRTLLVLDLESHPPGAAIDVVTIEVDPAPGRVLQYSLLERARPSAETLATLTARLGALVGESRCGRPALLDSHGPDAFEMRRFAPDEGAPVALSSAAPAFVASAADTPVASAFRRKDHQLECAVLRRFRPPVAIRVIVDGGRPRHVFIDRRGMPGGHIEQCAGPWRSSGAWWEARPWNRDEWEVALGDGSVCRVFQARDTGHWFLDGVFD